MKNVSKDSFDDKKFGDGLVDSDMAEHDKADAEKAEAEKKAEEERKAEEDKTAEEAKKAEDDKRLLEHEQSGMIGNPAEQYEHSIEEPVNPNQPDLSDRPTNDPSVYPSDPNKGMTPNPLPHAPQVEPLPYPIASEDDHKENMNVEEILARLLDIGNVAHHAGNQMDTRAVGHALRRFALLMHRVISETQG